MPGTSGQELLFKKERTRDENECVLCRKDALSGVGRRRLLVAFQSFLPRWMDEFKQRLSFDLSDALPCDGEPLPYLVICVVRLTNAETPSENSLLAPG